MTDEPFEDALKKILGMDRPEENEYARKIRELNQKIQGICPEESKPASNP